VGTVFLAALVGLSEDYKSTWNLKGLLRYSCRCSARKQPKRELERAGEYGSLPPGEAFTDPDSSASLLLSALLQHPRGYYRGMSHQPPSSPLCCGLAHYCMYPGSFYSAIKRDGQALDQK
jgi:hypothetical protein